jgi:hypothetical protein
VSGRAAVTALFLVAALGVGCGGGADEETESATKPTTSAGSDEGRPPAAQSDEKAPAGEEVHADPLRGGKVQGYTQPTTPEIDAHLMGETVVVRYRYPPPKGDEEAPWMLLTGIDSAGEKYSPATSRTILEGRTSGVVHQRLGLGDPPYELLVSTLAANGLRSEIARIPLPE